jgi:hypothetical protein
MTHREALWVAAAALQNKTVAEMRAERSEATQNRSFQRARRAVEAYLKAREVELTQEFQLRGASE